MGTTGEKFVGDFESSEVTELVGVKPIYLNKFVERRLYGVTPSVRTGRGRGRRRRFSEEDLRGIALVWWLFESGLRSQTIQFVLNQICDGRLKSAASAASKRLIERKAQFLVIRRHPRWSHQQNLKHPRQSVETLDSAKAEPSSTEVESVLVIPIGRLFSVLRENIEALQQTLRGE